MMTVHSLVIDYIKADRWLQDDVMSIVALGDHPAQQVREHVSGYLLESMQYHGLQEFSMGSVDWDLIVDAFIALVRFSAGSRNDFSKVVNAFDALNPACAGYFSIIWNEGKIAFPQHPDKRGTELFFEFVQQHLPEYEWKLEYEPTKFSGNMPVMYYSQKQ